jgi:hypothetical protein
MLSVPHFHTGETLWQAVQEEVVIILPCCTALCVAIRTVILYTTATLAICINLLCQPVIPTLCEVCLMVVSLDWFR